MTDLTRRQFVSTTGAAAAVGLAGCAGGMDDSAEAGPATAAPATDDGGMTATDAGMEGGMDPSAATRPTIDRFSEAAGTLMVRSAENDLPGPGEPIDFDGGPFLTTGLGPGGESIQYDNFDVQPTAPAPIYALFREGEESPVADQLTVVGTIPGDDGYNDFWHVHRVTVPADSEANTVTSAGELVDGDFDIEATLTSKNCPIVPAGSTAAMRGGDADAGLVQGWYEGQVVDYVLFEDAPIETTTDGAVPTSPIHVSFTVNPGEDGGGAASGFVTEEDSDRTHNVVATRPGDEGYSPLWSVQVYDNADFEAVSDLETTRDATELAAGTATVNCPIVTV